MDEQERADRRVTFDRVAAVYDRVRPSYPEELVSDTLAESAIPDDGRILEIGCGTGKATVLFARRGYRMLCIELGANLAAVAQRNVAAYPAVEFYVGAFEQWPVAAGAFDLAISAQAFHWLEAQAALTRIAAALKPDGSVALFWNTDVQTDGVVPGSDADFHAAAHDIYRSVAPELTKRYTGLPSADEMRHWAPDEIAKSELFGPVDIHHYRWDTTYDAATYTALLSTYSDHQMLPEEQRAALLGAVAALIDGRFGGQIVKSHITQLFLARKR